MQFKQVGNRIQVIAYAGYDREKKRSVVKMMGSMGYDLAPTDELISNLTDIQKKELQSYIIETRQARDKATRQEVIRNIDSHILSVADSLANGEFTPDAAWTEKVYLSIGELERVMRRPSSPQQPAPAPPQQPAPAPPQQPAPAPPQQPAPQDVRDLQSRALRARLKGFFELPPLDSDSESI